MDCHCSRFGSHSMKASQEPLEETKVGGGDLVVYPTLPGKPVQSQDTLRRKLLKACAGSNPTWIGAPSCSFSCQILCPHETGPDSALQGKHRATRILDGAFRALLYLQLCRRQLLGRHLVGDGFTPESQSGSCSKAVGMTSHFTGFGFDKVCETKPSCTGAEKARCVA
jgi:hypothetical protein